jgi:lysozyme
VSAVELALPRLKINEGFRAHVYTDTTGHKTIGYGCNLDAGITQAAAEALLLAQAQDLARTLTAYWWAGGLDEPRLSVLIEVAFNVGLAGLLHFTKCLTAIGHQDWQGAHDELLDSDAAHLLPRRYGGLAQILLTGVA